MPRNPAHLMLDCSNTGDKPLENGGIDCECPATRGIVILPDGSDGQYHVIWTCEGCAPEVMHEYVQSGGHTDSFVTVTLDAPRS